MNGLEEFCRSHGIEFQTDVRLASYTTFRIGGPVPAVVTCPDRTSLETILFYLSAQGIDFFLLGEGSNVLVSDKGLKRVVVRVFSESPRIERSGGDLRVYAGTLFDDASVYAAEQSLEGLIFASGIPGTFGGAVVGNAGAFGEQISDCLTEVEVFDRRHCSIKRLSVQDMGFSYRESMLKTSDDVVLSATVRLRTGSRERLMREREAVLALRHSKHPDYKKVPCAGSFFKNIIGPDGSRKAAGWYLDQAGCKKLRIGDAGVFEGHANIVINAGAARAEDIRKLSDIMKERVFTGFGIRLEPEVRFVGEFA